MGRIYKAEQNPLGRPVAMKVMRKEFAEDGAAVKRFFREAVAVSRLSHPNTITLYDFGEADGDLYIAMEWLEGTDLSAILQEKGHLSAALTCDMAEQISRSLAEAHKKGIIHRDLKPENLFITEIEGRSDFVKVLDFGIAKIQETNPGTQITRIGFVCGTPEFMSPEQARGEKIDGRSDLYSLGCMMFYMLMGSLPFLGETPLATVMKHQTDPVPELPPTIPASVAELIYRSMAKDPEDRPETADEFADEIAKCDLTITIPSDELEAHLITNQSMEVLVVAQEEPQRSTVAKFDTMDEFIKTEDEIPLPVPDDDLGYQETSVTYDIGNLKMETDEVDVNTDQFSFSSNKNQKGILLFLILLVVAGVIWVGQAYLLDSSSSAGKSTKNKIVHDTTVSGNSVEPNDKVDPVNRNDIEEQSQAGLADIMTNSVEVDNKAISESEQISEQISVFFDSNPQLATVKDETGTTLGETPFDLKLEKDKEYRVFFSHDNHISAERRFIASKDTPPLYVELSVRKQAFRVESSPPGATLFINGKKYDKTTPCDVILGSKVKGNKVQLKVSKRKYHSKIVEVKLAGTSGDLVNVTLKKKKKNSQGTSNNGSSETEKTGVTYKPW